MFRPLALYIGLRYTRARRRNSFISFISLISMLGIALGVTALITTMSVMNGFHEVIKTRILGVARQVVVSTVDNAVTNWRPLEAQLNKFPGVLGAAPFVQGQAMLAHEGNVRPSYIIGILPEEEQSVSELDKKMREGSMAALKAGKFGILIGEELADGLGIAVGDKVTVLTSQASVTPVGVIPRFKPFTVVGIFKTGSGTGLDSGYGFVHMSDAQALYQLSKNITGIRLKINDIYDAPNFSRELASVLTANYVVTNWIHEFGGLFDVVAMEKTIMFLLLTLLVMVAAFNLVSTLVMVVTDKKADIAILRTFGATPRTIMNIFIVQGCVVGVVGVLLGLIGGIFLAWNISSMLEGLENYFGFKLLASNFYYVNYLPSKLDLSDVLHVTLSALAMSLLATLYPAWTAARTQPAEALRYE
ncbi:MAG: lipoprotein-releasing ABC transporter permease subunit [Gammaproteobacteria bacterium]